MAKKELFSDELLNDITLNIEDWRKKQESLREYLICRNLIENLCMITGREVDSTIDKIGEWFFSQDEIIAIKNIRSKESQKMLDQQIMPLNYRRKK